MNPAKKRVLLIAVCCMAAAALIAGVIYATYRPTLTADFAEVQPASQGGAGVVYEEGNGFSADSVILESLALKTLAVDLETMDRLGAQEWLPVVESFFASGGETLAVLLPVQAAGGSFSGQLLYPDTMAEIAAQGWGASVLYVPGLCFQEDDIQEELNFVPVTEANSMKEAWCELYAQVRAADGGARLAGPRWGGMEQAGQQEVMAYWREQGCVPDVQQLAAADSAAFDAQLEAVRAAESDAAWDNLPLFVL
ncbi:MAG: hypothetical protein LIO46_00790 [Clostridiales bacterium]|nr:hypothetical protein [Clostridiales bacterium]